MSALTRIADSSRTLRMSVSCQTRKSSRNAIEALILVVEHDGPTMFARIGVMMALNRKVERVFNPDRKEHHWRRRKLARDQ